MDFITITLVRVGNQLVGRTASDRFNLQVLGIESIAWDRNQRNVKRVRRLAARLGLSITVERAGSVQWQPTPAEAEALGSMALPTFTREAA